MGMSAAHCQGNVREFQSVWRVVTLNFASDLTRTQARECRAAPTEHLHVATCDEEAFTDQKMLRC